MFTKRPIAENLAIAISLSCWSTAEIAAAGQRIFRKKYSTNAGILLKKPEMAAKFTNPQNAEYTLEAV